jgi:acetyl esterase/lipase
MRRCLLSASILVASSAAASSTTRQEPQQQWQQQQQRRQQQQRQGRQGNISYAGPGGCASCPSCNCLDYYPAPEPIWGPGTGPAVLLLHGGLWYSGSRGELDAVCQALVDGHNVSCATADYSYSQSLGGCCTNATACKETYSEQARQVVAAMAQLSETSGIPLDQIFLGGHSAGGHLALLLALRWQEFAGPMGYGDSSPAGFIGIEGIYNATSWAAYDKTRWTSEFACQTKQAFGFPADDSGAPPGTDSNAYERGSPTSLARSGLRPKGPVLLVHSPQDDWVQASQSAELFPLLKPWHSGTPSPAGPSFGVHMIDNSGECVHGEHPAVLQGRSAVTLAGKNAATHELSQPSAT